MNGFDPDRTGGGADALRVTERSGPPESGAPLEERRIRRVGDEAARPPPGASPAVLRLAR